MCSPSCSKCLGIVVILLAVVSTVANLLLLFPGFQTKYLTEGHITPEALWCTGIWASGFLVILAARGNVLNDTGKGCCQFRADMLCRIMYSTVAVAAAVFSFMFNSRGLTGGPLCLHNGTEGMKWERPLKRVTIEEKSYLYEPERWASACEEPVGVVVWNIVLFSTIMATSGLQAIFSAVQILNSIRGVLVGPRLFKNKVGPA